MRSLTLAFVMISLLGAPAIAGKPDGNRLAWLDSSDPYYVSRGFPKLTTPQWVGEAGVEAVVVLAIDDMRGHEKWEAYLRPILERLKQIDGRAAVSIMTCQIDPQDPHLQTWLKEGVSLETHSYDHPCPILKDGDIAKAKGTYDRCVDLLNAVPGNRPVAFRVPCCDSRNTPSPRFYAEIFNHTSPGGRFLTIDSSVFNIITADDPELPRELVLDSSGGERFRRYVPFESFVNTIEDYPYPYPIGRLCWEFPCVVPSDWSAQNLQQPFNPRTVTDLAAALDAAVIKQGVYNLVFHPHGWIRNDQVVQLIDHAVERHGPKVKFLTFREAQERLDRHLLGGQPLRAADGGDNGVRLVDLNNDGFQDVIIGNDQVRQTRLWNPQTKSWSVRDFPVKLVGVDQQGRRRESGAHFGILHDDGAAALIVRNEDVSGGWHFDGRSWIEDPALLAGLEIDGQKVLTAKAGVDRGVRLLDVDHDGRTELLVGNESQRAVFGWSTSANRWERLSFGLPAGAAFVDSQGRDQGLRLVDVDGDLALDIISSNEREYAFCLFKSLGDGWSQPVVAGKRPEENAIPMISRNGTDNGAWFHTRHLWVQNEDTARMKDLVDRRSFDDLLKGIEPGPRSPEAGLKSMRTRPGFTVELVAAEPLVMDPVAFDWGPDGKLWVVEMADYPLGMDGQGKFGGRVKFLEDTDGDGKYDRSTLFLDGLGYPDGVIAWRDGVLVSCAPEILYAADTNGDGRADVREPLYVGFGEGNQQHRMNGFWYGLDNWLYCANGNSGGEIQSLQTGEKVKIGRRDFRIRPESGAIQAQTGETQFGRATDDWGNWFGCSNSNPAYHFALDDVYLSRNIHFAPPDARVSISMMPGAAPVFPVSRTVARFNDYNAANRFTSACGLTIYRDELLGPEFTGNTFVSEPVHNLVHREIVTPSGATFTSRRDEHEGSSEFLASTDNWFRPAMVRTGPDGALWVADMYRAVIEHPEWIPKDWQARLDLRAGEDKGRIYRVYPVGVTPRPIPQLGQFSPARLVATLESPSGWQRDMAQRLLIARGDREIAPALRRLVYNGDRATALLHALCTLDALQTLTPEVIERALADDHPGVRRHAVRLCESAVIREHVAQHSEWMENITRLAGDGDPQVRMQVAYTLGMFDDPRAGEALGTMALVNADDRLLTAAVMSSAVPHLEKFINSVLSVGSGLAPPAGLVEDLIPMAVSASNSAAVARLAEAITTPGDRQRFAGWQFSALGRLVDALDRRKVSLPADAARAGDWLTDSLRPFDVVYAAARALSSDSSASPGERTSAMRLLGRVSAERDQDLKLLASLLSAENPAEIQSAAVETLAGLRAPEVPGLLLSGWPSYGPKRRSEVLATLFRRAEWAPAILQAVAQGTVAPGDIDAAGRQRLLQHSSESVKSEAQRLFAGLQDANRKQVVEQYQSAAATSGDVDRGAQAYNKRCAVCHRLRDQGNAVGPDLAALTDKSAGALLVAILDPNRAVEAKFVSYLAVTKDGLTLTGMLDSESGGGITLISPEAKKLTVLRSDLEALHSSGKSLMPEGMEKDLTPQDLADVMAYINSSGPQRKVFDGNQPAMVQPDGLRGEFWLLAATSEIYGDSLILEPRHGNLGQWKHDSDHAVWTIEVTEPGRYDVSLDYACDAASAGKQFAVEIAGERLLATVASSGSWDAYRRVRVGEVTLPAGRHRIGVRAAEPLNGRLMDLRTVNLRPRR